MRQSLGAFTKCNHTSLYANSLQLSPIEFIRTPRQLLIVDVRRTCHLTGMDLQDAGTSCLIGERKFNLPIKTTRTKEGRIKDIDSIGSSNDLKI